MRMTSAVNWVIMLEYPVHINFLYLTCFQNVHPPKKEEKLFTHFTGFNSDGEFLNTLQFLLPNLDRKVLIYWDIATRKFNVIDLQKLFEDSDNDLDNNNGDEDQEKATLIRPSAHKLPVEDEYLLVLMKL